MVYIRDLASHNWVELESDSFQSMKFVPITMIDLQCWAHNEMWQRNGGEPCALTVLLLIPRILLLWYTFSLVTWPVLLLYYIPSDRLVTNLISWLPVTTTSSDCCWLWGRDNGWMDGWTLDMGRRSMYRILWYVALPLLFILMNSEFSWENGRLCRYSPLCVCTAAVVCVWPVVWTGLVSGTYDDWRRRRCWPVCAQSYRDNLLHLHHLLLVPVHAICHKESTGVCGCCCCVAGWSCG